MRVSVPAVETPTEAVRPEPPRQAQLSQRRGTRHAELVPFRITHHGPGVRVVQRCRILPLFDHLGSRIDQSGYLGLHGPRHYQVQVQPVLHHLGPGHPHKVQGCATTSGGAHLEIVRVALADVVDQSLRPAMRIAAINDDRQD